MKARKRLIIVALVLARHIFFSPRPARSFENNSFPKPTQTQYERVQKPPKVSTMKQYSTPSTQLQHKKDCVDELPNLANPKFVYNLETKTAKNALKRVWKNSNRRNEVLGGLDRINRGELLPRHQKNFQSFKTLKEIKFNKTRMLVKAGKDGNPNEIVAIFMRSDLDDIASSFKGKYK